MSIVRLRTLQEPIFLPMAELDSPYARLLGLTLSRPGGETVVTMPPGDGVSGRPGFLHGGAIAGLLEYAAWVTMTEALEAEAQFKPISITVDYLRGGKMKNALASARIERQGRRIANVIATAWQDDRDKPMATANLKFLIVR